MGEEVIASGFDAERFTAFRDRLQKELNLLEEWFQSARFSEASPVGGFEVEAVLIDGGGRPAAVNDRFLAGIGDPLVVPELSRFNVELNTPPLELKGRALSRMEAALRATWERCQACASGLGVELLMTGILPSLEEGDLTIDRMSSRERYRLLNREVFRLRRHRPITLDILGREHLRTEHQDVMLEAAATSFQIHEQVPASQAANRYNAALLISAPMVAACANSPFLFGRDLWDETRIPLFEQAVAVSRLATSHSNRVTFGSRYVNESLFECFEENGRAFDVLLPILSDQPSGRLPHLRLHNGTIWRWNRPLVGFGPGGGPHLRVEHRVVPAGPGIADTIANAALFFGLMEWFGGGDIRVAEALAFTQARGNFYSAARHGLRAAAVWLGGRACGMRDLLLEELLPLAGRGLEGLGIDETDRRHYLGIIRERVKSGRNGATWQREFKRSRGADMLTLTRRYRDLQCGGQPVHEWEV